MAVIESYCSSCISCEKSKYVYSVRWCFADTFSAHVRTYPFMYILYIMSSVRRSYDILYIIDYCSVLSALFPYSVYYSIIVSLQLTHYPT
jgi:hypothetical protein